MDLNSFLKTNTKHPYERFSTESPILHSISPSKYLSHQPPLYKTQENHTTKTDFEEDYHEKIATMRHFYQLRLLGFEESLNKLYQRVFDDELLKTLRKDAISAEFVYERVKELFQEILTNDKEILLTNITAQYASLKAELRRVEAEKTELSATYHRELSENLARIDELAQELAKEKKVKENFVEENSVLKTKLVEANDRLKFEADCKEEERFRVFEGKKAELQEFVKDQQKKEENLQRLSQVNAEIHRNFLASKQEKEELQRKLREIDGKTRDLEENNEKMRRKLQESEEKLGEMREKLQAKSLEINSLKLEQRSTMDASFRLEKENLIKYEEFSQMIGAMEEKMLGQRLRFQEKKAKLKQKLGNCKKQLQNAEKALLKCSNPADLQRLEAEKAALCQKLKEIEVFVQETRKKHCSELEAFAKKSEDELAENQKKWDKLFEFSVEKLKSEHFNEISQLKAENDRLKRVSEEISAEIAINFVKKAEYLKLFGELQDLQRDFEEKDGKFQQELLQRQKFLEEKLQKDVELIQLATSQKVQFFEEKLKDETAKRRVSEEDLAKAEESVHRISKEKVLLEQELFLMKSQKVALSSTETQDFPRRDAPSLEKLEDFKRQIASFQQKAQRSSKELHSLRRKLEEKDQEIENLKENAALRLRKAEAEAEELEKLRTKAAVDEKTLRNAAIALKEELEAEKKDRESLRNRLSEALRRENSEFLAFPATRGSFTREKLDFAALEEKVKEKDAQIARKDAQLSELQQNFKELERNFQANLREKREFPSKLAEIRRKYFEFKEKLARLVQRKVEILRKDLLELRVSWTKSLRTALSDVQISLKSSFLRKTQQIGEFSQLKAQLEAEEFHSKSLENELQRLMAEKKGHLKEIDALKLSNGKLVEELASLQEKMVSSFGKSDKSEENKRLFSELMQLRAAIDTLYTKHKQILEEVTLDIEKLKEKQTEEISHINQNYTEMINVMTEKLESFKRDDTNKSTNMFKMSQRIELLEKVNKELETKLNYSAELPAMENPIKSYESPSLKSGRIENSRVLQNKSLGEIYETLEKEKSEILEQQNFNYYGPSSNNNNKNVLYSSISRENDQNNLSYMILNDDRRIKQFNSVESNPSHLGNRPAQLSQREVDELKNLLEYTYKNVAENKETTKKFMEEADNLTDKVKELQKMHEFIGNSSFIKKYQSMSGLHKSTKSHDSPEFPNYTEKLAQLYSPISVKPGLEKEEQAKIHGNNE